MTASQLHFHPDSVGNVQFAQMNARIYFYSTKIICNVINVVEWPRTPKYDDACVRDPHVYFQYCNVLINVSIICVIYLLLFNFNVFLFHYFFIKNN